MTRYLQRLGVVGLFLLATTAASPVPHISECKLCHFCHLGDLPSSGRRLTAHKVVDTRDAAAASTDSAADTSGASILGDRKNSNIIGTTFAASTRRLKAARKKRAPAYDPELDPTVPIQFKPSSYRPRPMAELATLPECPECYGCDHNLTLISDNTMFMNNTYSNEMGATSSWIFKSNTNMTPSGEAVVKMYCLPLPKRPGAQIPTCNPARIAEVMRHLSAVDKLSVECGFTDLVPRMWLAPVLGVVPGVGYPVNWWGLWMEYVDGISLENLLYRGKPKRLDPETIAHLLNTRLNTSRVVRGAIFDLLTSQCDRHAQNVFMQEDGNIKLIDNEACLQHMWRNCGFDSILVPTTQKQEIARLANHYVLKLPPVGAGTVVLPPLGLADPQLLLDYRCYLSEGQELIGTQYPPEVDTCLRRIAGMTANEVRVHFGFPDVRVANNLLVRAKDMMSHGYEWAAKYGEPRNANPKRYRFQPKCCELAVNKSHFKCAHEWKPHWELPLGNPITGREWDKDRPDPGKYPGGTFPEDGEMGMNGSSVVGGAAGGGSGGLGQGIGGGGVGTGMVGGGAGMSAQRRLRWGRR